MKNSIYAILCLFLFSCVQRENSENQSGKSKDSILKDSISKNSTAITANPTSVSEIKKTFGVVNDKLERRLLDSVSFKYDCDGERNGMITYFSEEGKLVALKHSYSEYDHFSAVDQYFVYDSHLYFAFFNRRTWSFESGHAAEGATKDNITEQRFYIASGKPLLCLEKKYTERSQSSDNPNPEKLPNKEVTCKSMGVLLTDFDKLLAFKENANHDCLGK